MRLTLLTSVVSICATVASATRVMYRPDNFQSKYTPNSKFHIQRYRPPPACSFGKGGKVNIAYFTSWGIYGRGYTPRGIDTSTLTHINYAFADTDPATGKAFLTDLWADQQITYPGDDNSAPGNNLYGNLKQFYLLKKRNRNLKVLLSIGGWTYSQAGHFDFAADPAKRTTFCQSAIQLMEDNGLDGLYVTRSVCPRIRTIHVLHF
ncbi:hypothetical protein FRC12_004136 [Ceratobasidium sp. 428]|nr:hypothetical protein FRC12_004136 [Ceratobasidium sp. 428]